MPHVKLSRRGFLKKTSSCAAGAFAMPYVITSSALGTPTMPPASERVTVGHIGVGNQGGGLLRGFLGVDGSQSIAVCDAFKKRREQKAAQIDKRYADATGKADYKACVMIEDYRELLSRDDIDAVVIATPDHWHVPIAMEASRRGKDMYVEKPLSVSMDHNKALRASIHRYGNIFQYGTQQRCFNTHCAHACELVQNGYLGDLKEIHVTAPAGNGGGSTTPIPVPDGLNYDLWLGPAPMSPYTKDRCTNSGSWFVYANSIGFLGGWGAHPLDIMHWGYPEIPVTYEGTGKIPTEGLFNTVTHWDIKGQYGNGMPFTFKDGPDLTTFVGEKGWVAASRGGIKASAESLLSVKMKPGEIRLLQAKNHYQNFIDATKTRQAPASPIDSAVQSDYVSHLSNVAIRTGRKITWDPKSETIVGDPRAHRMANRSMRAPWTL